MHDDPILVGPDGRTVTTWMEGYPYTERMTRRDYEITKRNDKKRARVNALRHVLHTLDYGDKDITRIGATDPLIVGPAATVYETGENPAGAFPPSDLTRVPGAATGCRKGEGPVDD